MKKKIVWEWAAPLLLFLSPIGLIEVAHSSSAWWRWIMIASGWIMMWSVYAAVWRRWRVRELDRIRHERLPRGRAPSITLIMGQDLACGQVAVVNDRGFVVAPEPPLPPPGDPTRIVGCVDDAGDLEIDLDGLEGP